MTHLVWFALTILALSACVYGWCLWQFPKEREEGEGDQEPYGDASFLGRDW